ncbi:MAG: hypothetical protein AB7F59_06320 [Bdellovibrionales bacterium]
MNKFIVTSLATMLATQVAFAQSRVGQKPVAAKPAVELNQKQREVRDVLARSFRNEKDAGKLDAIARSMPAARDAVLKSALAELDGVRSEIVKNKGSQAAQDTIADQYLSALELISKVRAEEDVSAILNQVRENGREFSGLTVEAAGGYNLEASREQARGNNEAMNYYTQKAGQGQPVTVEVALQFAAYQIFKRQVEAQGGVKYLKEKGLGDIVKRAQGEKVLEYRSFKEIQARDVKLAEQLKKLVDEILRCLGGRVA